MPEEDRGFPESGAVALFDLTSADGIFFGFTIRAKDGPTLCYEIARTLQYAEQTYGWKPTAGRSLKKNNSAAPVIHDDPFAGQPPQPSVLEIAQQAAKNPSAAPASVPAAPANSEAGEQITISTIEHSSHNGKHFIKAKGGRFTKYGLTVWPEAMPERIRDAFEKWAEGHAYNAPEGMKVALTDGKKVLKFIG
jgi:hypothetical protein